MLDKFILVPYEIQGKDGKIIIKECSTTEQIKYACVQDYVEKNLDDFEVILKLEYRRIKMEEDEELYIENDEENIFQLIAEECYYDDKYIQEKVEEKNKRRKK